MQDPRLELLEEYSSNLQDYLDGGGEAVLKRIYVLAREAMADGVGVLEMAALHHEAMARVLRGLVTSERGIRTIKSAEIVFVESLSPFEMAHRGFQESNLALRRLNEQLEGEAQRIAHALHDEASQLLVSVHLAIERATRELPPQERRHLAGIDGLLDEVGDQIRRLSHELRPTILDDLGLLPALKFLAEGVGARASISVVVTGELAERLHPAAETAIYRSVKEALSNMTRHARATHATIEVHREAGRVVCSVRDNGTGFDAAAVLGDGMGGLGLVGIRERLNALGGTLQISSAPGHGADLIITIPTED
jgi:signal transduction histidine kinase